MNERYHYAVLHAFNEQHYKDLLTNGDIIDDRKPINMGTKDNPDIHIFYPLKKELKIYALPEDSIVDLPILPTQTIRKTNYGKVYDIITKYKSARFKAEKILSFRQLVDDLCDFEHEEPKEYTVWKIIALAALLGRCVFRVSSKPAFGKDSIMNVLSYLTNDVTVIANPTVAKLEYRLTNKVMMLNEFANLSSEDRKGMEHFLQSVGDDRNVYEKQSRASSGTRESYNIGELSVVVCYNNKDCYPSGVRYFDDVFGRQTKQRYIPFTFKGKISEHIRNVPDPKKSALEHRDYLVGFIRSVMYYKEFWRAELAQKGFVVPKAQDFGLKDRWANNFDRLRDFVILYSETEEEAKDLLNMLWNAHVEYQNMIGGSTGALDRDWLPKKETMDVEVIDMTK